MGISELRKFKKLEEETSSLRKLVADLSLDKHILQEIVSKKLSSLLPNRLRYFWPGQPGQSAASAEAGRRPSLQVRGT